MGTIALWPLILTLICNREKDGMHRMLALVIVVMGLMLASCITTADLNRVLSLPTSEGGLLGTSQNQCESLTAISAKQLAAGIEQAKKSSNPIRESKKYDSQRFKVTGTITGFAGDSERWDPGTGLPSTATRVMLDNAMICRVPADTQVSLDSLNTGQTVTVCGVLDPSDRRTVNGKSARVLRNCYIVQY